jgi:hypothetical protein
MTEYPYYIRTLTKEPSIPLLNYLYQKKSIDVIIETDPYTIFIQMKTLEEFNEVLEEVKKYYIDYIINKPLITKV